MDERRGGFQIPGLLLAGFLSAALFIATAPVSRCGLCGGVGERFAAEVHATEIHLACPRCCPHGFIEPGRKATVIRNWLPGLTTRLTRADVDKALRQPKVGPDGLRRFQGYR
jgi:hypothetical protein